MAASGAVGFPCQLFTYMVEEAALLAASSSWGGTALLQRLIPKEVHHVCIL